VELSGTRHSSQMNEDKHQVEHCLGARKNPRTASIMQAKSAAPIPPVRTAEEKVTAASLARRLRRSSCCGQCTPCLATPARARPTPDAMAACAMTSWRPKKGTSPNPRATGDLHHHIDAGALHWSLHVVKPPSPHQFVRMRPRAPPPRVPLAAGPATTKRAGGSGGEGAREEGGFWRR
jgi:hypothetical protein